MKRRPTLVGSVVRTWIARLSPCAALLALLLAPSLADAGDPPTSDPIVGEWSVDLDATTKGVSEAVALDLDALPPTDLAEELLRRETFLRALRFTAKADGSFVLGIGTRRDAQRTTAGTWVAKGEGRYTFTLSRRFGVPVSGAEAGPLEATVEEIQRKGGPSEPVVARRLSYRDRDGAHLVFEKGLPPTGRMPADPKGAPPTPAPAPAPAPVPAPAPAPAPVPGSHPAGYVAAWELDRDRMVDVALALARKQVEALEPEQRKLAQALLDGDATRDRMRRQFEAMQIEIELRADGTLQATLGLPGRDPERAVGTWQELDGKVVLILTAKDGKPASETDRKPVHGRLDGGLLWLEMAGDASPIPLRKLSR